MEQLNEAVKNCDFIIEKLGEINAVDLQKLYDCEYISKSVTLDLTERINKLIEVPAKFEIEDEDEEFENEQNEIELYEIIKIKLNALLSLCNDKKINKNTNDIYNI